MHGNLKSSTERHVVAWGEGKMPGIRIPGNNFREIGIFQLTHCCHFTSWKMALTDSIWNVELYSHAYIALERLYRTCLPRWSHMCSSSSTCFFFYYYYSKRCLTSVFLCLLFCSWHRQLELSGMQTVEIRQVRKKLQIWWVCEVSLNHDGRLNWTIMVVWPAVSFRSNLTYGTVYIHVLLIIITGEKHGSFAE